MALLDDKIVGYVTARFDMIRGYIPFIAVNKELQAQKIESSNVRHC